MLHNQRNRLLLILVGILMVVIVLMLDASGMINPSLNFILRIQP
jgi:hypothetical protein